MGTRSMSGGFRAIERLERRLLMAAAGELDLSFSGDTFVGGGGNDRLFGRGGLDTIWGGAGIDLAEESEGDEFGDDVGTMVGVSTSP